VTVTAEDLDAALAAVAGSLRPATELTWITPASSLEWDCWQTAEHLADVLVSYAAQLVARPATRYVRFLAKADTDATPAEMLEFVQAGGGMLVAAVRTTPREVRAYHPSGMADAEGFAAMGCVETLVHGHDIAEGLGVRLDAPRDVCARVLTRLFPDTPDALGGLDPWQALLWATGRRELGGHPRRAKWRWQGAPAHERA
jgi:uncharacterized protein (TIGR03083 family)